ncbi:MAG: FKBP-type peptidyl-prolyl cis-trans isomerase [Candidatus Nanohaloarchaea archaeon]|nr:FKBP-type peptidyl-prolyl cis-trans isomerase [Candidatus Nanohaloarchaea archaeon]
MVQDGDVVEIHYVGRVQESGEIFDLTAEDVADEEGYETEEMELGPVKVLIGAGHVIPGLETALRDMDEGDEQTVEVGAEEAFGERESDNIETFSSSEFDEYDVEPRRGLVVEIDGRRGKIISTSSGRVRVDFNHPLAGKGLEYDVEVLDVVDDVEERVKAVLEYYGLDELEPDIEIDDGALTVTVDEALENPQLVEQLEEELERVNGVEMAEIAAS